MNNSTIRSNILRALCVFAVLAFVCVSEAQTQAQLRSLWHDRIKGHRVIPYSSSSRADTADALAQIDAVPGNTNNVVLIYGGTTLPTATFGASNGWNREHLWPDSYGLDGEEPAYSDLHNLRPADSNVNSARGNKWYDISSTAENRRVPGHAEAPETTTDTNSWEPPARERGDIARAVFYMDLRYEGDAQNEPDLRLIHNTAPIAATNSVMGRFFTLFRWHQEDPPDAPERARNDRVEVWQGNRNPFIDNPELVELIYAPQLVVTRTGGTITATFTPVPDVPWVLEQSRTPSGPWQTNSIADSPTVFFRAAGR